MAWQGWSRRSLSLLLIVSVAFNVGVCTSVGVLAYRNHYRPPEHARPRPGHHRFGLLEDLHLTEQQLSQVQDAKEEMFEGIRALRRELRSKHEALSALMAVPEPDREAIAAQLREITGLREKMDRRVVEHLLSIKALLGPDQQEAFNETIHRAFSRGGPGRAGFGGRHGLHQGRGRGKGRGGPFQNGVAPCDNQNRDSDGAEGIGNEARGQRGATNQSRDSRGAANQNRP